MTLSPNAGILIGALLLVFSSMSHAFDIKIIDQQQNSVANAVIEIIDETDIHADPNTVAIIDQINKTFAPDQIIIRQGQSVDFPNSDNIRHHVYSFSEPRTFELRLYADKPEKPILFPKPGIVVIGCNIHDSMIGYIYVAQHQHLATTDENGNAQLALSETPSTISVWHPYLSTGAETRGYFEVEQLSQNAQGEYLIQLELTDPPARESFEDTFGAVGHH